MARNDPFNPDYADIADTNSVTFDGSASSTNAAIISELAGNGDAQIFIEESNDGGSTWQQIAQLADDSGNTTFTADWHTQYNRLLIESGVRRVKITNVDGTQSQFSVSGDER